MQFLDCLKSGTDFMDMRNMIIYHISEYVKTKRFGLPTEGLVITDPSGNRVGIIEESDMQKYIRDNNIEL